MANTIEDVVGTPTAEEILEARAVMERAGMDDGSPVDVAQGWRLFKKLNQLLDIIGFLRNVATAPDAPPSVTDEVKAAATLVADTIEANVPSEMLETARTVRALLTPDTR